MAPKERPSRPFFDERAEDSVPAPRHVPRPGIPENVARELGEMSARIDVLERSVEALENRAENTGKHHVAALEKKIAENDAKEEARKTKEAEREAAIAKERRDRRFDLFKSLALLALGGVGGLLVTFARDCKTTSPVVVPVSMPAPLPTTPPVTPDAGVK